MGVATANTITRRDDPALTSIRPPARAFPCGLPRRLASFPFSFSRRARSEARARDRKRREWLGFFVPRFTRRRWRRGRSSCGVFRVRAVKPSAWSGANITRLHTCCPQREDRAGKWDRDTRERLLVKGSSKIHRTCWKKDNQSSLTYFAYLRFLEDGWKMKRRQEKGEGVKKHAGSLTGRGIVESAARDDEAQKAVPRLFSSPLSRARASCAFTFFVSCGPRGERRAQVGTHQNLSIYLFTSVLAPT